MFGIISSVVSGIVSCVGKIFVETGIINLVIKIFKSICEALGIIKPDEKPEEIGDKIIQAEEEGYKLEDFTNYEEYKKFIDNFKLDPEKSQNITLEDKNRKFIEMCSIAMQNKYPNIEYEKGFEMMSQNIDYFNTNRSKQLGVLMKNDPDVFNCVAGFLSGAEKDDMKLEKGLNALILMEKANNPKVSDEEAIENIISRRK